MLTGAGAGAQVYGAQVDGFGAGLVVVTTAQVVGCQVYGAHVDGFGASDCSILVYDLMRLLQ